MSTTEQMEAAKPKRENYATEEEFDEAYHWWMHRQGRVLAIRKSRERHPMQDLADAAEARLLELVGQKPDQG